MTAINAGVEMKSIFIFSTVRNSILMIPREDMVGGL